MFFPGSGGKVNQQPHHYETIPYHGPDRFHGSNHSPSPQPPIQPQGYTDHKRLAQQRLDYYFMRQQDHPSSQEDVQVPRDNRRESSPAEYHRVLTQYRSLNVESPIERKHSDTELMAANQVHSLYTCIILVTYTHRHRHYDRLHHYYYHIIPTC